jgi:hypothetical protein
VSLADVVLVVWLLGGLLVSFVNAVLFWVIAKNWGSFSRWRKQDSQDLAQGVAKIVVDKITNPDVVIDDESQVYKKL